MSWASSELVQVLTFLLPGFVAAAVFYAFTSHPKPGEFERLVQALIFTIFCQVGVVGLRSLTLWVGTFVDPIGMWSQSTELVASVGVALALGVAAVRLSYTDSLHALLRQFRLTRENSYPSVWYSAFSRNPTCYVVLHLKGERRLFGWPVEWSSIPSEGHFRIAEPEWLVDDRRVPAEGVTSVLVAASDVEMVEFLPAVLAAESRE